MGLIILSVCFRVPEWHLGVKPDAQSLQSPVTLDFELLLCDHLTMGFQQNPEEGGPEQAASNDS
jgi:hypothetical protein